MSGWRDALKPVLVQAYSQACATVVQMAIARREPERSFHRVAVVAALGRQNGIANGARLQCEMLRRMGIDAELVDASPALRNPLFRVRHDAATAYIVHCGGPQTPQLLSAVLPAAAHAWRIGYWAWELPDPPSDWNGFDRVLNEIWTPSRFAQESLRRLSGRPIEVVPHVVLPAPRRRRDATRVFTVLSFGDSRSSLERKNPAGALAAFRAAFGDSPRARLVLKLGGPPGEHGAIERAAAGCANVSILRDFLTPAALAGLYRSADVLLSLHRAEGFGLPMLEAMGHGIPVVATGWSGNLDFMTNANAVLVPARLVPVADGAGIYQGSVWADPDIEVAAAALRGLAEDPARWERLSVAAHEAALALSRRSPAAVTQLCRRREQLRAVVAARIQGARLHGPSAPPTAMPAGVATAWQHVEGDRR
ncbi:glycosyltransferase family 4 protein [Roseomonas eburnea]|uniref:Glycosyltransferase family 4 protein n=1 Tax=Neoroseomonas eburnea TaxID=1346889 RepID=A0A9X9X5R6_9PROT|nr:glycosyltransferase family 4 protein [Neoroseomonas eburnea]MBR0679052.1 glycosyltransferase family 4 protein [Neoroseomonas eburnea]